MFHKAVEWQNKHYDFYRSSGGVISISVCHAAEDTQDCHVATLAAAINAKDTSRVSRKVANVVPVEIDEETFHGSYFDYQRQLLLHNGTVDVGRGRSLTNPFYKDIGSCLGGSSHLPDLWTFGEFAYAFCQPAYGLKMKPFKIHEAYLAITSDIVPRTQCRILSWQKEEILNADPWLEAGQRWWGVFVFSVYNNNTGQLFGIAASDTD